LNKVVVNAKTGEVKKESIDYKEDNEKPKPTLEERLQSIEEIELERLMS